jgi:hypothetical protein
MQALYPKIISSKLTSFLQSLAPETVIDMWVTLCAENNYAANDFNWDDFESMVSNNPTAVGLELVECYIDDHLREYPYSNNEMDEKISEYLNDSEPTA